MHILRNFYTLIHHDIILYIIINCVTFTQLSLILVKHFIIEILNYLCAREAVCEPRECYINNFCIVFNKVNF